MPSHDDLLERNIMITWKPAMDINNTSYPTRLISEDGRFEIKKETMWCLYDDKSADRRWCRQQVPSLDEAKKTADWILREENEGRDPYRNR